MPNTATHSDCGIVGCWCKRIPHPPAIDHDAAMRIADAWEKGEALDNDERTLARAYKDVVRERDALRGVAASVCDELDKYGQELRNDWSDFDGRAGKATLLEIAKPLRAAIAARAATTREADRG